MMVFLDFLDLFPHCSFHFAKLLFQSLLLMLSFLQFVSEDVFPLLVGIAQSF